MMEELARIRLTDMIEYATKAVDMLGDRTPDQLESDDIRLLAVTRAVQIVGEAARKVPPSVRARAPTIAWRLSVGMRNTLVHDYGDVDVGLLVATVRNDFPPLIAALERLLGEQDT